MAEQPLSNETPSSPTSPKSKIMRGCNFVKLIGILVLIVLLAAVIFLGFLSKSVWDELKHQQLELVATQNTQAEALQQVQQVAELQPQLNQQQKTLSDLNQKMSDLTQKVKQINMPFSQQQSWQQLQQVEFQLRLAQQYLTIGVINLPLALQLVTAAKQQLLDNKQTLTDELQVSVATLQQQLLGLRATNFDYLFAQLTNLMLLTEQLSITPQYSIKTTPTASTTATAAKSPATATHWYQRQWDALRTYLGQAIVVRHQQHSVMPLSLSQRQLHSTEIRMALLQAQWAILQQNQASYMHSLQRVQQLLQTYFNGHTHEGEKMLQMLQPLTQVELNPSMPAFVPAFQALEAAYTQLKIQMTLPSSPSNNIPQTESTAPQPKETELKDRANPPLAPLKIPPKKKPEHTLNPAVEI